MRPYLFHRPGLVRPMPLLLPEMTLAQKLRDIVLYNSALTDAQVRAILDAADMLELTEAKKV